MSRIIPFWKKTPEKYIFDNKYLGKYIVANKCPEKYVFENKCPEKYLVANYCPEKYIFEHEFSKKKTLFTISQI